jgi:Circadian oscillating protein COP23
MKVQKSLLLGLTTVAIALTATPTFSQSSSNKSILFGCDTTTYNTPTTIAYNSENPKKQQPLIKWKKEYIDSQNLRSDCESAAKILKNRYDKKEFRYLALERNSENKTVVCWINEKNERCNPNGEELFLLQPVNTRQELYKALSETIDPALTDLDQKIIENQFRASEKIIHIQQMKPRSLWKILFN